MFLHNWTASESSPLICPHIFVPNHEKQDYCVYEVCKGQVERPQDSDPTGAGAYFVKAVLVVGNLDRERGQGLLEGSCRGGVALHT